MCKHCEKERLRHHGKIGIENGALLTTWVSNGTAEAIDALAYVNGLSRSATIAAILEKYLYNHKEEKENDRD